jgi:colicin import membrane protein
VNWASKNWRKKEEEIQSKIEEEKKLTEEKKQNEIKLKIEEEKKQAEEENKKEEEIPSD